ncbi:MAG: hypothetical protein E2598_03975 [Sphingobium sp.]|nr:hypothetical protein [Sphingobium sp.]
MMTGALKADRRQILKGSALLSLLGATQASPLMASAGHVPMRFIVDRRLPEAEHIIGRARQANIPFFDPEGEIIHLLRTPDAGWLKDKGRIIGLTGYSDLMLAQDALREAGKPLLYVAALTGNKEQVLLDRANGKTGEALSALLFQPDGRPFARSTRFIWAS